MIDQRAIVFDVKKFSSKGSIISLFAEGLGKVRCISSYSNMISKSNFRAIDLFYVGEISIEKDSKDRQLRKISNHSLKKRWNSFSLCLEKLLIASFFLEISDLLTEYDNFEDSLVFCLLFNYFENLESFCFEKNQIKRDEQKVVLCSKFLEEIYALLGFGFFSDQKNLTQKFRLLERIKKIEEYRGKSIKTKQQF